MVKTEKHIFYSNLYSAQRVDEVRNTLYEEGNCEVHDKDIWNRIDVNNYFDWINFEKLAREKMSGKTYILNGFKTYGEDKKFGGFLVTKFEDLYRATDMCNNFEIMDEKGHFCINGEHDKGIFSCEIKELNSRGLDYYEKYKDKLEEQELLKKLNNKNYSKLAKLLKD